VKNGVAALESPSQGWRIAKVTDNVLDVSLSESAQIRVASAENAHGASFVEECEGEIGADEACTAGNEDVSQERNLAG
jgi:hypothetical protein